MLNALANTAVVAAAPVNTTETIIAQVAGVSPGVGSQKVALTASIQFTPGASTTGLVFRWRRGPLVTDTVVGGASNVTAGVTAGALGEYTHNVIDVPADGAYTYSLTVTQTAGAANGAVGSVAVAALIG